MADIRRLTALNMLNSGMQNYDRSFLQPARNARPNRASRIFSTAEYDEFML